MKKQISILDDKHEIFNPYKSQCYDCKHYKADTYSCEAFPKGISNAILSGESKHNNVIETQVGITIYSPTES